ncbi:MAG: ABC-F family ATP-binding cassette domain-containing protein [Caldilineaceae bacterium SB0668_bin_21]|nr:ABC-F family ATP-binding cassette domain-containing protein [Caldilineaceae bacterium SB0668_bin_21]MYC20255.1 ABC-F family ATP-binding cassette domain-containing protein [Caldilineaceae bacterium SB0662_bin_25]
MSLLVASHISKNYGDLDVLEDVSVRIEYGDRIGLVGQNGAGKTSLLRALGRIDSSVTGEISVAQGTQTGYLAQDPPPAGQRTLYQDLRLVFADLLAEGEKLHRLEAKMTEVAQGDQDLSGLLTRYGLQQEAFERAGGYDIDQRIRFVLSGLGLDESLWQAPLSHLSGGQRTRASLGRLLLEEPDLLLLDEPTNHLDVRSMAWLEGVLTRWNGALVVVSHDRYFLDSVATRIWDLAHRRVDAYRGNYSHYRLQREERRARWRKEYDRQQEFIRETQAFVRRYKAGQRTKEAQGRETRLKRFLEEEALPPPPNEQFIRLPLRAHSRGGDLVMRTRKLIAGYKDGPDSSPSTASEDGVRGPASRPPVPPVGQGRLRPMRSLSPTDTPILEIPDLDLLRGQVAALIGPNGAGKTTFVRTILEELEPLTGRVELGASVDVGYLAQRHIGKGYGLMDGRQTVLDALLEIKRLPTERARTYLGQFLFKGDEVFQSIESLSGGQRSRIALARLTLQGANFLLLDEPTNHLDLDSQEILQDALRQFDGTILLVTHDRALIAALATQIWQVTPGNGKKIGLLELFKGSWKQWQEERLQTAVPKMPAKEEMPPTVAEEEWDRQREARRLRQRVQRQEQAVAETEERVARMENRLTDIEESMAQASARQDFAELKALQEQHNAVSARLEELMEEWAALAA